MSVGGQTQAPQTIFLSNNNQDVMVVLHEPLPDNTSVAVTVNGVQGTCFDLNIIPHTAAQTTLGDLKAGSRVNLEIDILARYIGRMLEARG